MRRSLGLLFTLSSACTAASDSGAVDPNVSEVVVSPSVQAADGNALIKVDVRVRASNNAPLESFTPSVALSDANVRVALVTASDANGNARIALQSTAPYSGNVTVQVRGPSRTAGAPT